MHSYAQEVPIIHTCARTSLLCGSVNIFDNLQINGLPSSGAMSIWQHGEETRAFKLMHKRYVNHMATCLLGQPQRLYLFQAQN